MMLLNKLIPSSAVLLRSSQVTKLLQCNICLSLVVHRKPNVEIKITRKMTKPKPKAEKLATVWKGMTVKELANASSSSPDDVFEALFLSKFDTDQYDRLSSKINEMPVITDVVKKLGRRPVVVASPHNVKVEEDVDVYPRPPPDPGILVKRPPVVTVMGHVDHGKTTLLDALRHSNVVASEFGGITQHIGAFSVKLSNGDTVTFLDTPGHAAFSAMRSRGAHATDIVVLVVAADDGVMEQTKESIKYARQANGKFRNIMPRVNPTNHVTGIRGYYAYHAPERVPIVVAINKIDRSGADIERTKEMLLANGIQLEDLGGDVIAVPVSALKRTGLEALVEALALQADLLEIKADPKGPAEGVVIEAKTDTYRGKISTMLVQRGMLKKGAYLVAGTAWCKVKTILNDQGKQINTAPPGTPIEVIGWKELPSAGDVILEVENEKRANEVVEYRKRKETEAKMDDVRQAIKEKEQEHLKDYKKVLERRREIGWYNVKSEMRRAKRDATAEKVDEEIPRVSVIVKGDVDGSVEAIVNALNTYYSNVCELDLVHYGVGAISEGDVKLAVPFKGIIYGFNVTAPPDVKKLADSSGVEIRLKNVIYKLFDDLKEEIDSKLPPKEKEEVLGQADILQEFIVTEGKKKVAVAGCRCTKGQLKKSAKFRLRRGEEIVFDGSLTSMRHLKNEVDVIKKDVECGLRLSDPDLRLQTGDVLECYELATEPIYQLDIDPKNLHTKFHQNISLPSRVIVLTDGRTDNFCDIIVMGTQAPLQNQEAVTSYASVEFEVSGQVQGCYFPKYCKEVADILGIGGWIKNTKKGTIVGKIQGEKSKVEELVNWLAKTGSPGCRIDKCELKNWEYLRRPDFKGFSLRF